MIHAQLNRRMSKFPFHGPWNDPVIRGVDLRGQMHCRDRDSLFGSKPVSSTPRLVSLGRSSTSELDRGTGTVASLVFPFTPSGFRGPWNVKQIQGQHQKHVQMTYHQG
jgi:hypothetical protein